MKCYYFEFEKLIVYEPVCLKFGYIRNSVKNKYRPTATKFTQN